MSSKKEIEEKFWKALKSDMTVMLGLVNARDGHTRPMTAQRDGDKGPLYFFTAKDTALVKNLGKSGAAMFTFASKEHDLFATVNGTLSLHNDRATIDRLWNRFVAAWYEDGKDDPKLALLRFEPKAAEIWLDETSLVAGLKLLLGADPKDEYKDKVAEVKFR